MFDILIYAGIAVAAISIIGLLLTKMYRRAPKDAALVRTGFGGEKVIMNGGTIVVPILHELMEVSLKTVKLKVERRGQDSLITLDKFRVDVEGLFHIRVAPNQEAVAAAAQTLGANINSADAIRDLLEGKIVSALRSTAATMKMEDIHVKRQEFTQEVQQALTTDLAKNGFELETVSLTHFDQTPVEFLNPENAFDAEGLTRIKEITEDRKKVRNEIEALNRVAIEQRNYEANKQSLDIAEQDKQATLEQKQRVESLTAETEARISATQARQAQLAEQERIKAEQETKVASEQATRLAEEARIAREQAVELARQAQQIAVSNKSKEESVARKAADEARAQAVSAQEGVVTAKVTAEAERAKRVAVIDATREAEQKAVGITVQAQAEREAAQAQAEAVRTIAEGDANAQLIRAEAEAKGERLRADAKERTLEVEAEGQRKINEADNLLSPIQVAYRQRIAVVEALPEIVRESYKPMEKIDSIRIVQVGGLGGNNEGNAAGSNGGYTGNLVQDAVHGAVQYRVQRQVIDRLLADVGMTPDMVESAGSVVEPVVEPVPEPEVSKPVARVGKTQRKPEVHEKQAT